MYNKLTLIIVVIIFICCFNACTKKATKKVHFVLTDKDITVVDETKTSTYNLLVNIEGGINVTKAVEPNKKIEVLDLLKSPKTALNKIALTLTKNNGNIRLTLSIPEIADTTIIYHFNIRNELQYTAQVHNGICASISGLYDVKNTESQIIKWLYLNNIGNIDEKNINRMCLYLQALKQNGFNEYVANGNIPVVTSFRDIQYKISSNLTADNYYLFACKNEKEVDNFVADMISVKFEGATHSLNSSMPCFRSPSTSGTIGIFLVGINKDWSYKIAPVGVISIDNVKPSIYPTNNYENQNIVFAKNKLKIKLPANSPVVVGYASLSTRNWGGNGLSCNVNFAVDFGGDIKSITLVRDGVLAKWLSKSKKIIDLQGKESPFLFTYELHLENGDNYIPVIITDYRGNKTEYKYNVPAEFTRSNNPQINIDNDINIY